MSTAALSLTPRQRRAFGLLVASEIKIAIRRPIGLIVAIGIPLALLVIFGSIPATTRPDKALGGISFFNLYVPSLLMFVLIAVGLTTLPQQLSTYRQQGVLRRMSTTPVPPSWLLAAQGVVNLCVAVSMVIIVVAEGIALGAPAPKNLAGFAVAVLLAIAGLFPIGLLIAAVARTGSSVGIIGRVVFFPLIFLAGLWWPRELMPGALQALSTASPLGATVQAIQASAQGQFPPAAPLLVLAAYAVVFGLLARRFFRWE